MMKDNIILYVNLSTQKITQEPILPDTRRKYIGASGINTKILFDSEAMYHDALSEKNLLIFGVGPAVGTGLVASNRCTVTAKSPLTDFFGDSSVGGNFPVKMRAIGIDHLVFTGKADKPVYVYVNEDGRVQILDATDLWGAPTGKVTELLVERHAGKCEVACIGPAGENLVRFASIIMSKCHVAGRMGMGCVMGSKHLKAVVIESKKYNPPVHDEDKLRGIKSAWAKTLHSSVISRLGGIEGTLLLIKKYEKDRRIPIRNFQSNNDEKVKYIYPEQLLYQYQTKRKACNSCSVACCREYEITHGKYKGEKIDRIHYAAVVSLGPCVGVFDWPSILHLKTLTDDLGMDVIEVGGVISFILECQQRGILTTEGTDGKRLQFGNADDVEFLMHLIANRKGIGDLVAEGAYRAAKKLNAEQYVFCIKKSIAGLHANSNLAWSLSYLTSSRGPDHLKGYVFTSFGGFFWELVSKHIFKMKTEKAFALPENKGRIVWWHENYKYIIDALGLCIFAMHALPSAGNGLFRDFADIMNTLYNLELTGEDVFYAGERTYQMQNAFNINCGLELNDYQWPKRLKEANVDDRLIEETTINVRDHSGMLPEYFKYRGLTSDGKPTVKRFIELGLLECIEKAKAVNYEDVKTCEDMLQTVDLNVKLTTGEKMKYFLISSLSCWLLELKEKRDKKKYFRGKNPALS